MADLDRMKQALRNAHRAGDDESARKIATAIKARSNDLDRGSGAVSQIRTASGGFLEGIPVVGPMIRGGVERAAAATLAPFSDMTYGQVLDKIHETNAAEKRVNPGIDTAAQLAGAIGGTIPMVAAAPAAFGAGGGSLLARSGASLASGAALGGADAGVRSGGDMDAIRSGTMWGAGLGAVAPAAGAAIGKGVGAIASRVRGPRGATAALGRAASADGIDNATARLSQMGDDAMVMDLGPNLQRQAGALASIPGDAQQAVRSAIADRGARAGGRVTGATNRALGQNVDTLALVDDIAAKQQAAARPLYEAAYSRPVNYTEELEALLKRPTMGKALSKARGLAADEGIPSRQWFADIADDGTVTLQNTPDVRQLDLTKRALDDMISTAQRQGNNNEARIFTQLKNQLVGIVDQNVPEYAQARAAFAGPARVREALEEGQKVFSNKITPNELRTQMMRMGQSEREAFVQGARAQIADAMGTARNDALKARQMFQQGYNQEKLALLIGDEQAAQLINSLDNETAFMRTRDIVTGNSETAARQAAQADIGARGNTAGVFENAGNLQFGTAALRMADKAFGGFRSAAQERANTALAQALTSNKGEIVTDAVRRIQTANRAGQISDQRARELIQAVTIGGGQSR